MLGMLGLTPILMVSGDPTQRGLLIDRLGLGGSRRRDEAGSEASGHSRVQLATRVWTFADEGEVLVQAWQAEVSVALEDRPPPKLARDADVALFAAADTRHADAAPLATQIARFDMRRQWLTEERASAGLPPAREVLVFCSADPIVEDLGASLVPRPLTTWAADHAVPVRCVCLTENQGVDALVRECVREALRMRRTRSGRAVDSDC